MWASLVAWLRPSIHRDLTMEEAWNRFVGDLEGGDDGQLADPRAEYQRMSAQNRQRLKDEIKASLLDIDGAAAASEKPMLVVRAAAMKAIAAVSIAEEFFDPSGQRQIRT